MTTCTWCQQPMQHHRHGRYRTFCSQRCVGLHTQHQRRLTETNPDPIAIARLIDGHPPKTTTPTERIAAVIILTRRGHSAPWIAHWLGVTPRTVTRYRATARLAA